MERPLGGGLSASPPELHSNASSSDRSLGLVFMCFRDPKVSGVDRSLTEITV